MSNEKDKEALISRESRALGRERSGLIRRGLDSLLLADKKEDAAERYDIPEANFVEIANLMIHNGDYSDAEAVLREGIASMPRDWQPRVDSDRLEITFWNMSEFEAYADYQRSLGSAMRSFFWTYPSYSKAFFLLAFLDVEGGNFDKALHEVNNGLALEPDHPKMLCAKGFILRKLNRPEEALAIYEVAATARAGSFPVVFKAEALRGQGFCLMEIGRFDEAEKILEDSLVLEPNTVEAVGALDHIASMKALEQAQGQDRDDSYEKQVEIFRRLIRESKATERDKA